MIDWNDRFWSKVAPEPNSGCWLWMASTDACGYGRFGVARSNVLAHRNAYVLVHGAIPGGMHVLHRCDVRACVNPDHLFLGTHADNMADMANKGRGAPPSGDRHWSRLHPEKRAYGDRNGSRRHRRRGETNSNASLTNSSAADIRALLARGAMQREVAAAYGVSQTCISRLAMGRTYAVPSNEIAAASGPDDVDAEPADSEERAR
ncbi:MAG: HNH endonuclease [Deltaproteobacteria bacterium]|nr:HNH endonuclease [Deltaproteobacteria bacterium]